MRLEVDLFGNALLNYENSHLAWTARVGVNKAVSMFLEALS